MADTQAVKRADAFERIALPYLDHVMRFALSLTRDEVEANDLVQDTFLAALRGWHTFTPGTDCRKWLFTICRNTYVRQRSVDKRIVLSDEEDLDALPVVISHVSAQQAGLGDLFDRIEVGPAIREAVDGLPEPHHSILVLVDLEGMTYREASEVLEVPVGTVRSRLYRARRMVQEALVEHAGDMGLTVDAAAEVS
jgi:RNA polymerase sigma-70 factor (ECF subfamily)